MIGRVLDGRYEVVELAGEGAMGAVYRARHKFMNIDVAVKTLHHELTSNEELVERFRREAQAAAHIAHPNVCAATDFGQFEDGSFFLVMEWLAGPSLEALLHDELILQPKRAIHIAAQIADALVRAHELEIVHRDLKPANILIIEDEGDPDFVKVTDFGVARVRIGNAAKITQAGIAYGTPAYMAPEQAAAREELDYRADIYSLGIILYEMLSGSVPFQAQGIAEVLAMQVTEIPAPLGEVAPHTPPELAALVMKCLEKAPEGRPQSAEELARQLRAIGESLDDTAPKAVAPAKPVDQTAATALAPSADSGEATPTPVTTAPAVVEPAALPAWLPRGIAVAVAAAAAVIFIGYVGGSLTGGDGLGPDLATERAEFSKQPEIAAALEAKASGDLEGSLKALESAQLNYETNAHYQFLLGSALIQAEEPGAYDALEKAIKLDERYADEAGLRKAVIDGVFEKPLAERSVSFLAAHQDDAYRALLYDEVLSGEKRKRRERALEVLQETEAFSKLPEWQQDSAHLVTTRKCSELEPLLQKAIKAEDDRLVPALEFVADLPTRGCGFLKRSDCYECVRDEIAEAEEIYKIGADDAADAQKSKK